MTSGKQGPLNVSLKPVISMVSFKGDTESGLHVEIHWMLAITTVPSMNGAQQNGYKHSYAKPALLMSHNLLWENRNPALHKAKPTKGKATWSSRRAACGRIDQKASQEASSWCCPHIYSHSHPPSQKADSWYHEHTLHLQSLPTANSWCGHLPNTRHIENSHCIPCLPSRQHVSTHLQFMAACSSRPCCACLTFRQVGRGEASEQGSS